MAAFVLSDGVKEVANSVTDVMIAASCSIGVMTIRRQQTVSFGLESGLWTAGFTELLKRKWG